MKENHQFHMNEPQYYYQLKKWGISKTASKQVWQYFAHQYKKRGGKPTQVLVYGHPVPEDKLHRQMLRHESRRTARDYGKRG
ncbi:hypothetical protein F4678DRAFT_263509 [Xylaria arbuscula]|nr:hypothetical protein F4678DRAFT_263509 [Xylaria arbuscula]